MKEQKVISFEVGPDGEINTIYKDELVQFAEKIGGEISTVCRASNVEWESWREPDGTVRKGWSVRAAHQPALALRNYNGTIRCSDDYEVAVFLFDSREKALEQEVKFFFELLPPKDQR